MKYDPKIATTEGQAGKPEMINVNLLKISRHVNFNHIISDKGLTGMKTMMKNESSSIFPLFFILFFSFILLNGNSNSFCDRSSVTAQTSLKNILSGKLSIITPSIIISIICKNDGSKETAICCMLSANSLIKYSFYPSFNFDNPANKIEKFDYYPVIKKVAGLHSLPNFVSFNEHLESTRLIC